MPGIFTSIISEISDNIQKLTDHQTVFNNGEREEINNDETKPWTDAYNNEKKDLNPNNNTKYALVETVYDDLNKIVNENNNIPDMIDYVEDQIKSSFGKQNLEINEFKTIFENSNEKYRMANNFNSATSILKIDSYDRNIEENFYIMYYLLSYGVLGLFIYKLLKL